MASIDVSVSGEVEFAVGEKTRAWLVSLGWTPPVEEAGEELVEAAPIQPSRGMEAARVALNSREGERDAAKAMYYEISGGTDDLDRLLAYFGVNLQKFLAPTRTVEIPGLGSDASSGA